MANKDLASLIDESIVSIPQEGDTVTGIVISASKSEVKLDINGVMTGVVRGRELYYESADYAKLQPGDTLEATVVEVENENGELELSFRHAGQEKTWLTLTESYEQKINIKVRVKEANRGGLLVSYHQISGFLPVSQLSPENYPRVAGGDKNKILEKLKSIVGKELDVQVITLDRKDEKLVVSEKNAWQEKQKDVISKYKVGDAVEGDITAVTNFGVFVSFADNLEGLIHISELAWQRIDDPSDIYKVGDRIKAEIISINGSKIFLSAKKLINDPWQNIQEKYKLGENYKGQIIKINPFGLFVELDQDIHGLAHVSQISLAAGQKIDDCYKIGETHEFTVMSIEPNEHRLGLTIKGATVKKTEKTEAKEDFEEKAVISN
ncbi:30S ribosomal protein S1 [Candidatus Falkowbacteria bacterium CG10_big_fil_rev_8_21_14_0_10_37_14]|uniref:30S ribosomal protein S1 n=1 Tax=Candidatus Falkowbacteria bacterium CG10_big_fil_rev_8_21_14_0_10_37_14 TaxID=1974561 RepID=A0A2M6WSQ6_9BACT|nr:S1 RNA-binding domain-containing protein [Candidatus Falkowbacteria bacterium]PIT95839.1 MAG: 30S ribosomal protein S1 [Candidatus Falkowbacteria bacterium CG10_big_fil_rev_8_21_14_0_10_37_14]